MTEFEKSLKSTKNQDTTKISSGEIDLRVSAKLSSVKESRKFWAIFQFPFFFWQVLDNKELKTKCSSIAVWLFGSIVNFFVWFLKKIRL